MVHFPLASTTTVEPSGRVLLVGICLAASPAFRFRPVSQVPVGAATGRPRPVSQVPVGAAIGGFSPLFSVMVVHVLELEDVWPVAADTPRPNPASDKRTLIIALFSAPIVPKHRARQRLGVTKCSETKLQFMELALTLGDARTQQLRLGIGQAFRP
jgi:hypothetical protein